MPRHLIVLENPESWNLALPGVEVVAARDYLTDPQLASLRRAKVYNMCRTRGYQTIGYYVSLLAAARGHRPLPSVTTIQDLRSTPILRVISEDLARDMQRTLAPLKADRFVLSIYFGRNLAKRYDPLCQALFNHFPAPFLRAEVVRPDGVKWRLESLRTMAAEDIPDNHYEFVIERARRYFARPPSGKRTGYRYDIAILVNPGEVDAPSDKRALERFARAARSLSMRPTFISKEDSGRLAEYDALFIRETTSVNHHTYRFARRAEAEGLVVMDDPTSIIRCSNKVYQAELFERHGVPCPRTMVVHRQNAATVGQILGFPCVLKRPDSSFSLGVVKASNQDELTRYLDSFFQHSELVVAQAFVPSTFDWRIGVLDGRALYVCKYFMARGHWQVYKSEESASRSYGKTEPMPVEQSPTRALEVAEKVARLIGDGLYGLDIKQVDGRFLVMEINDNPNVDAGSEDAVLKDDLYRIIMQWFYKRIEQRGRQEMTR